MGKAQAQDNADDKDDFVDELKPGTKLMHGQYTIESFLNAGGFGITYLARDSLDRKIVIKECFPGAFCRRSRYVVQARSRAHQNELKSIVRLFVQEARSLAKLDHPNIVGVHQVFEDNETAYMALDFVEGRDLLDTIEDPNHGLTPAQIKVILKEVLGAVGFVHEQGILHRDISPDNILINEQFHPVLIDFGAAREEATKQSRILSALRVVKDGYSPQEFYIAGSEQGPCSDLYALGASMYHLIAKEVPPNSQARLSAIASNEADPFVPLAGRHPEYDASFLEAIDRALAVLPKDRLQSAQEWLEVMEGRQGNVTPLKVTSPKVEKATAAESAPKSKMPLLLGSAAVVALLVGVGVMTMSGGDDVVEPITTPTVADSAEPAPAEIGTADLEPVAEPAPVEVAEPVVETAPAEVAEPVVETVEPDQGSTPEQVEEVTAEQLAQATEEAIETSLAPVIVEEVAPVEVAPVPVEQQETPAIAEDSSAVVAENEAAAAVVGGPVIVEENVATPVVRPTTRPERVEVAVLPEVGEPILPEPVATPRPVAEGTAEEIALPDASSNRAIAPEDSATVTFPMVPEAVNAIGAVPVEEIPAFTPGNELPPPAVASNWSVQLPFVAMSPDSNKIGEIGIVSPTWVKSGLEITSIDGSSVNSIAQIQSMLRAADPSAPDGTIQVSFGTRDPQSGEEAEYKWTMPVIQHTELLNGLRFNTVFAGSDWRTSVVEIPEGVITDLRPRDVIISYISTSENVTERDTLARIFERELESGTELFIFAVQREGSMWVASLTVEGE